MVGLGRRGRRVLARRQAGVRAVPPREPRGRRRAHRRAPDRVRGSRHPGAADRRRAARRAGGGGGRLRRPARPHRPRARQEPARPRAPAPRRPRPHPRPRRPAGRRGGGERAAARRARGRRRGDPVRRRHQHLRQPRAAARGDPHGDLGRPRVDGPRARDRRHLAARARGGRRLRPAAGGAAQRARLHVRPLPRLVHALDAGRLDRHALVGHAVRPLRRHRRLHPRPARGHARRAAGHAPGAGHLDRPERARDGARLRGPAGDHLRGDRPGPPPAARAHDPRLPVPQLGRVGRRHARHRGQRGGAVGHPRGRRQRDRVQLRDQEGLVAASTSSSRRRSRRSCSAARATT